MGRKKKEITDDIKTKTSGKQEKVKESKVKEETSEPKEVKFKLDDTVSTTSVGKALNKKHKLHLIFKMSKQKFLYSDERRISSGELKLDIINGGGWLRGRVHKIQGRFSSGKSTFMAGTLAEFTGRHKEKVLLIDYEGTWTTDWLSAKGANLDLIEYTRPYSAELAMDIFEAAIYSNEYSAVILDSVASMSPEEEQKKAHNEASMSKLALLMNRVCRELQSHMNRSYLNRDEVPTIFMVNQIRKSPDRFNPEFTPGGGQQDNLASTILELTQRSKILENPNTSGEKEADEMKNFVGNYTFAKNIKNKIDPPHERGLIGILHKPYCGHPKHSFFHADSIATVATKLGLIEPSGAWYNVPVMDRKFQGSKKLWSAIMSDYELRDLLVNSITGYFAQNGMDLQYSSDFLFPSGDAVIEEESATDEVDEMVEV